MHEIKVLDLQARDSPLRYESELTGICSGSISPGTIIIWYVALFWFMVIHYYNVNETKTSNKMYQIISRVY